MENGPSASLTPAGSPPVEVASADLTGRVLGDFRIMRKLGQGGMGQVYLAEQQSLKRPVALKIMRADLAANPIALKRFQAEAEAVARVTHANIVQVYAIGQVDGLHYMALEYVEGRNLRDYLSRKGVPDVPLALSIMVQVAAALQRAADSGIVHRDIKPENILLSRQGEVKVADFGLSRLLVADREPLNLTQSGVSLGTPLYMSPEQVQGHDVDPRTDIYSLGVTCYHMLAGEPPFRGQNAFDVAVQHVQKEPEPLQARRPDLPAELCAIVHKMMAKKPEERYQSPRDLILDLTQLRDKVGGGSIMPAVNITQTGMPSLLATAALPAPPAPVRTGRGFKLGIFVLTLAVGFAAGLGLRLLRSKTVTPTLPRVEPVPSAAQLHEKALAEAVKGPFDPRKVEEAVQHLEKTIELGSLYLEQRRLKEAQNYFQMLRDAPPHGLKLYQAYGRIGLACVLAFQDQAKESNELFLEIERAKPPPWLDKVRIGMRLPFRPNWKVAQDFPEFTLLAEPEIRRIVAEALTYNAANMGTEPLPEALERLRKPPVVTGKN